jgi:protein SCO1/2
MATSAHPQQGFRLVEWPASAANPAFALVDFNERPRTLADYHGKVLIVYFGFTHCPDACPAELTKLALMLKKLGSISSCVQILFITLDPVRDTPALLKGYVTAFDPRFMGLTGTPAQIDAAARAFFVQYARVQHGTDYVINHSTRVAVIDPSGRLRLIGTEESRNDDLVHDVRLLTERRSR